MLKGSIIRVKTVELFDERTMLRNKAKWVYGVIAYLDDACEETGDKSWAISWATKHLHFSDEHYNHFLPQNESDIELVLEPGGEHIRLDKYYTTKDFFVMKDEEWKVKEYERFCEYCRKINCDRMKYWEELDYAWSQMRHNAVHDNAKKRKFIYCSYIQDKHGYLGRGNRMVVPKCICKYAGDMFPPPPGVAQMGHRDN